MNPPTVITVLAMGTLVVRTAGTEEVIRRVTVGPDADRRISVAPFRGPTCPGHA